MRTELPIDMKVFCIIVTYNGSHWVEKCFGSLRSSTIPLQTIVVDNRSTDNTLELLSRNFPEVELVKNEQNLGFGAANNVGIIRAMEVNADFIFLLNQDAWIFPDTIAKLVAVAIKFPLLGILSPVHLQRNEVDLDHMFAVHAGPGQCDFFPDLYAGNVREVYHCGFVNAAAWLISGACVEAVGLFEPLFRHYGEDNNYVERLRYHGYSLAIVPGTTIVHDRSSRKPVKSSKSIHNEVKTYLYMKLFNMHAGMLSRVLQALKVFSKFGLSAYTVKSIIAAYCKIPSISERIRLHRERGYLLKQSTN